MKPANVYADCPAGMYPNNVVSPIVLVSLNHIFNMDKYVYIYTLLFTFNY